MYRFGPRSGPAARRVRSDRGGRRIDRRFVGRSAAGGLRACERPSARQTQRRRKHGPELRHGARRGQICHVRGCRRLPFARRSRTADADHGPGAARHALFRHGGRRRTRRRPSALERRAFRTRRRGGAERTRFPASGLLPAHGLRLRLRPDDARTAWTRHAPDAARGRRVHPARHLLRKTDPICPDPGVQLPAAQRIVHGKLRSEAPLGLCPGDEKPDRLRGPYRRKRSGRRTPDAAARGQNDVFRLQTDDTRQTGQRPRNAARRPAAGSPAARIPQIQLPPFPDKPRAASPRTRR